MTGTDREGMTVTWTKIVPRTLARAYFNVILGFVLLGFLIWAIAYQWHSFNTALAISDGLGLLVVGPFLPRSIRGLIILRREARERRVRG